MTKSVDEFHRLKSKGRVYPSPYCKPCTNAYNRERRANGYKAPPVSTEKNTRYSWLRLLRLKGITEDEYNALVILQEARCAICRTETSWSRSDRWAVDHDHVTGKVRGLLCHACNMGIGHLKDDVGLLRAAIKYLEDHKKTTESVFRAI